MNKQQFTVRFKKDWSWDQKKVTVQASSINNAIRMATQKVGKGWKMLDWKVVV